MYVYDLKDIAVNADGCQGLKFLVKWEGWEKESDMTWEPEAHLRQAIIPLAEGLTI